MFDNDYFANIVASFLKHCGSIKNKEQLEDQLDSYFRSLDKEILPKGNEAIENEFEDEFYRKDVLA